MCSSPGSAGPGSGSRHLITTAVFDVDGDEASSIAYLLVVTAALPPVLLVSGVYYSIDVLPGWMQVLSRLSPATYVLDGVRSGLIDGAPITALVHDVWPLLVMGAFLIPFGLWAFGRAERYAKRTGKLKRVG